MQIWRFWKKAQKNLEIRTSNLETSKICVKWKQQRQIICFRVFFNLLVFFVLPWVVDSWPWVGIPNRDSHGQTVRVGRSVFRINITYVSATFSALCLKPFRSYKKYTSKITLRRRRIETNCSQGRLSLDQPQECGDVGNTGISCLKTNWC